MQDGLELEERDFFADPFTEAAIRELFGERDPADFFSWSSPSFRKMGLKRDELSGDRLIEMMVEEPRLVKRPLVRLADELIVGTDKKAMLRVFGGGK